VQASSHFLYPLETGNDAFGGVFVHSVFYLITSFVSCSANAIFLQEIGLRHFLTIHNHVMRVINLWHIITASRQQ